MRFRKSNHSIYRTKYHLVWIPRYRRKIFVKGVRDYAQTLLSHIEGLEADIEVIKLNVQLDHVHLVAVIPPRFSVASVVSFIKTQSAKALKAKFPFLDKVYVEQDGVWSTGYCVSSVGLNEKEILHYVQYQEKEDKGQLKITF
jgi:putative transposase